MPIGLLWCVISFRKLILILEYIRFEKLKRLLCTKLFLKTNLLVSWMKTVFFSLALSLMHHYIYFFCDRSFLHTNNFKCSIFFLIFSFFVVVFSSLSLSLKTNGKYYRQIFYWKLLYFSFSLDLWLFFSHTKREFERENKLFNTVTILFSNKNIIIYVDDSIFSVFI